MTGSMVGFRTVDLGLFGGSNLWGYLWPISGLICGRFLGLGVTSPMDYLGSNVGVISGLFRTDFRAAWMAGYGLIRGHCVDCAVGITYAT